MQKNFVLRLDLSQQSVSILLLSISSCALCSCDTRTFFQKVPGSDTEVSSSSDITAAANQDGSSGGMPVDPTRVVCDPFGGDKTSGNSRNGLLGKLFYLATPGDRCARVATCQSKGTSPDLDLYFSQLNVPTRAFDQGFSNQEGSTLTNARGEVLIEWFSLHFDSVIRLKAGDHPGKYQFALAADDGAIMQVGEPGLATHSPSSSAAGSSNVFKTLIDNDGTHATRFKCATQSVRLESGTELPIKVDYYQGPRYHIALVLLWREIPENVNELVHPEVLRDAACDQGVDSAHGWKVVDPDNFQLPKKAGVNPCVDVQAP